MYNLKEINSIISNCTKCKLSENRTKAVFGEGNRNSDIMIIGEGPGYNEDLQGRPFVGKAGKLLDKMLTSIDLDRKKIYITNIVKCRPPNNRNPFKEEINTCIEYLRWQVKLIDPKIIITLGSIASKTIIDENIKITKERGSWRKKGKFLIMPIFHPAALLRDENKKKPTWKDLKNIKQKYIELRKEDTIAQK